MLVTDVASPRRFPQPIDLPKPGGLNRMMSKLQAHLNGLLRAGALTAIALILAGVTTAPLMAQRTCNASSITGYYGLSDNLKVIGATDEFTDIGLLGFDGVGVASFKITENGGGTLDTSTSTGTYVVNSDCTGTATFENGASITFVVVFAAQEIDFMFSNADGDLLGTGTAKVL